MSRYSSVDMDAVAPLMPADRKAALVAGKGEHFEFTPKPNQFHTDLPPAMREPTKAELGSETYVEMRGVAVGRLKVIGLMDAPHLTGKRWVVRCVCGSYEIRRTKYLRECIGGKQTETPMCAWCGKTKKLQLGFGEVRDGPLIQVEGYK